jgi:spermidine/putrescine transport system permease protein
LDDYIVTFFNNGVGTDTLPLFVYGSLRQKISPEINALSTLMLIASMLLVGFSLTVQNRSAARR